MLPEDTLFYVIRARPRQKAAGLLIVPAAGHVDCPPTTNGPPGPSKAEQQRGAGGAGGLKELQFGRGRLGSAPFLIRRSAKMVSFRYFVLRVPATKRAIELA